MIWRPARAVGLIDGTCGQIILFRTERVERRVRIGDRRRLGSGETISTVSAAEQIA